MSVELIPRWQRGIIAWMMNRRIRKGRAKADCTACGAALPVPPLRAELLWDLVVECPQCGHAASLPSLLFRAAQTAEEKYAAQAEGEGSGAEPVPVSRPPTTRVTVEDTGSGRVWRVPAKGGCNLLLVMAAFWLTVSTLFLAVMLKSRPEAGPLLFISAFVLIGLGVLFAGLVMSRAHHTVALDAAELVHTRHFLGHTRRKAFPRESIHSVKLVVFYEENYKPIHGIEIRGERGKIRFGSALTPEEKAWLCLELRHALGLEKEADSTAATRTVETSGSSKVEHISVERGSDYAVVAVRPGSLGNWILLGAGFVSGIAIFMIWSAVSNMWIPGDEGLPFAVMLLFNGFITLWCAGVAAFLAMALGVFAIGWRVRRTSHLIHATRSSLSMITTCGRHSLEQSWNAADVRDLRVEEFMRKNNKPVLHAVILLRDRVITFGAGGERGELEKALGVLGEALGGGGD